MFGKHDCDKCRQDLGYTLVTPEGKIGERVIAAALWYPDLRLPYQDDKVPVTHYLPCNIKCGIVYASRNHLQSMYLCYMTFGVSQNEVNEIDGFLTSENRFVDRDEAGQIAFRAGQMPHEKHLFSEDLFED